MTLKLSRQMVIGWLTLLVAILAMPQFTAIVPPSAMPWVACASGAAILVMRWLGGALGDNPLSAVGAVTLIAGLLSVPEAVAVIPVEWMAYVTAASGVAALIARFMAGASTVDPAGQVNALFRVVK